MQLRFIPRSGIWLASFVVPALLMGAGCGGGTDGSKSPNLKVNEPRISGTLTFSNVTPGSLVNAMPLPGISSIRPAVLVNTRTAEGTSQRLSLSVSTENAVTTTLALALTSSINGEPLMPFRGGQRLTFPRAGSNIELTQNSETSGPRRYRAVGGTVVVRGVSAANTELQFEGVRFDPVEANTSLGSFTLNGTLVARALTTSG